MASGNREELIIDGEISPLRQKLREAAADLKKFGQEGGQAVSGMTGPLEMLRSKFVAIGAALTAGGIMAFIQRTIDAADNLGKLSQKIGVSVEDLAGFQHAANLSDLSLEQFSQGVKQLSKYMTEHGDKLRAAGITATDTKGALIQLADAFQRMQDGPQKTAIAMELFGKQGAELIPLLNGGGAALRSMMEEGQRFNPITKEMSDRAQEFNDSMTRMQTRAGAVGVAIASDLLPHLNRLFDRLQQATQSGFVDGFMSRWKAVFMGLAAAINEAMASVEEFLAKITFGSVAENHMKQAISLRESARRLYQEMAAMAPAQKQESSRSGKEDEPAKTNLASLLSGGKGASVEAKDPSVEAKDPSFMQYYEAELALRKSIYEQENTLRQFSKEQELAYWREVQQNLELTNKDRVTIAKRTATLELEIRRQAAKEQRDLDSVMVDSRRAAALAQIQFEEQQANFARQNGDITKRQLLELEEQFARRRFEIEYQSLLERLELAKQDPNASPAELARIKEQMLEIERNYQLRRGEILQGVVTEQSEVWNSFTGTVSSLWDKGIAAMMNGTLTWRNAWRAVLTDMARWFVESFIGKKVKAWLAGEVAQTAVTKAGTAARSAIEGAAALKSVALWAWTAGKNIMVSAWEAMAAAWKAVVGIPIVGPVLAPIAAAAAFAGVSRLAKRVASAEGGYDIPKGVNPLVQTHEEEMILPRQYANVIRGMAAIGVPKLSMPVYGMPSGITAMDHLRTDEPALKQYATAARGMVRGGERDAPMRGGDTYNWNISTPDPRAFRDFLKANSHALVPALEAVKRNFQLSRSR